MSPGFSSVSFPQLELIIEKSVAFTFVYEDKGDITKVGEGSVSFSLICLILFYLHGVETSWQHVEAHPVIGSKSCYCILQYLLTQNVLLSQSCYSAPHSAKTSQKKHDFLNDCEIK